MGIFEQRISEIISTTKKKSSYAFWNSISIMVLTIGIIAVGSLTIIFPDANHIFNLIGMSLLGSILIVASVMIARDSKEIVQETTDLYEAVVSRRVLESLDFNNFSVFNLETFQILINSSIPDFEKISIEQNKKYDDEFLIFQKTPKKGFKQTRYDPGELVIVKDFKNELITKQSLSHMANTIERLLNNDEKKSIFNIFIAGEKFDDELLDKSIGIELLDNKKSLVFFLKKTNERIELI